MIFSHIRNIIANPDAWHTLKNNPPSTLRLYLGQMIWYAAIPAFFTFYGTTKVGWRLPGSEQIIKLTMESALWMAGLAWLALLVGIALMGWAIHWLGQTFNSNPTFNQSIVFSSHIALPFFIAGIAGIYPTIWSVFSAGALAIACSTGLLYIGLPKFMAIPKEQGFVYASAILCIGLVVLVALMIITVLFWNSGLGPEYIHGE